jgi:membrane fusion protein, copper/silver efflux system
MENDERPVEATAAEPTEPTEPTEPQAESSAFAVAIQRPGWRRMVNTGVIVVLVLMAFAIGTRVGDTNEAHEPHASENDQAKETVWTCSMHPQIRMEEFGSCPICGMDLVPAGGEQKGEHAGDAPRVTFSARARALARVRTDPVVRTDPRTEVRLLGRVDYDETRLHMVTPWTAGRIEKLHVRVTGSTVRKGQVVATLYSPEVYAAMRDLVIAAKQAPRVAKGMHGAANLANAALESARERLRLLGVPNAEIAQVEKDKEAPSRIRIRSAYGGTLLERKVEEGDYVATGAALFYIADLSRVWIQIDAYESDLPYLSVGQTVLVEVQSLPGQPYEGKVAFIDPIVDRQTRTARVRMEVPNPDGDLRPGMFAQAVIEGALGTQQSHLVIPSTAPLFTGRRSVVYVEVPRHPGTYELREVRLGPRAGPVYPVLAGLSEGERVVSQGAFVIDADLQLQGGRSMMTLPDDLAVQPREAVPVTPEMLATLEPTALAYLGAQEALAADDLEEARKRLGELAQAAGDVVMTGPAKTREAWQSIASGLTGHARHGAMTDADGELRKAFEHASASLLDLLSTFGNPTEQTLRVAFCPMAFDAQGAQWVQGSETVANPYYGARMLRCGDVRATVLPGERLAAPVEEPPPAPPDAAGVHQH